MLKLPDCIPAIMDSQKYQTILERKVMPSADKIKLRDHWSFHQDTDHKQHIQVNQSLAEEKILHRPGVAFSVTRFESNWLGFMKKAVSAFTDLEAFAHDKFRRRGLRRL